MIKPLGNRVIVKITKNYLTEKGKPVLDENGKPMFTQEQEAKVLSSNVEGIKKGDIVYPIIRGGVPIYSEENNKSLTIVIDEEDIYAKKI